VLEVNEQPCEVRPIASEGSLELRYLHSTQNLYDYLRTTGNDTVLYVKLLRGDPPIKAVEFDGYLVLKNTLNGDKVPICRTQDLEITLVSPDIHVQVRIPTKQEHYWRNLSEVRAAELQCMQLALALLARHESEVYVNTERDNSNYKYNGDQQDLQSKQGAEDLKKHVEECEKIFSTVNNQRNSQATKPKTSRTISRGESSSQAVSISDKLYKSSSKPTGGEKFQYTETKTKEQPSNRTVEQRNPKLDYRNSLGYSTSTNQTKSIIKQDESVYNKFHRPTLRDKTSTHVSK